MDERTAGRGLPLLRSVAAALEGAPPGVGTAGRHAERVRALMYAEAIDDADEADALLRFGPRLAECLESLGVADVVDLRPRGRRPSGSPLAA